MTTLENLYYGNINPNEMDTQRGSKTDQLVKLLGKVTNEQFRMLSDGYNIEQREIQERIPILQKEIEDLKAASTNVERFVAIANKYTDLQELTVEVLRTFVQKIVIHERTEKWAKTAEQQIDIYFRYVGNLTVQPVE